MSDDSPMNTGPAPTETEDAPALQEPTLQERFRRLAKGCADSGVRILDSLERADASNG